MAVSAAAADSLKTAAITLVLVAAMPFVAGLVLAFSIPAALVFLLLGVPLAFVVLLIASGLLFVRGLALAWDADTWRDRAALVLVERESGELPSIVNMLGMSVRSDFVKSMTTSFHRSSFAARFLTSTLRTNGQ